jgi:hypothetical protein
MWIFLKNAYLSIVANRDDPGTLLVRGRRPDDIEQVFPGATVTVTPHADYRYRTVLPRQAVAGTIASAVAAIDYDNFKSGVDEIDRHDAYLGCWAVLREWQGKP